MTRGGKVCAFIGKFCRVPEGSLRGEPVTLLEFQRRFIHAVYDNPAGTSRAFLSMARKNGKTSTIAMMLLAHIVGPEAVQNSRIVSGARTRKQAAEVYNYAAKMVALSPELRKIIKPIPSQKILIGLPMNVEYQAISADAKGAHGGSPVLAILDEVGQVRGPYDAFIEAIETSQGAYEGEALLIAISTQGATDGDLFSQWLDDAENSKDPRIVSHVYRAPEGCELIDRKAWAEANPALGVFRSLTDVQEAAERAARIPTSANTFRWLFLNQRIDGNAPLITREVWEGCSALVRPIDKVPVYGGLDLSAVNDLTALVLIGKVDGIWQVHPTFWIPGEGLHERSKQDRVPYDLWQREGKLVAAPGRSIDYAYVAAYLRQVFDAFDVKKLAFDSWNFKHLRPWLLQEGFTERELAEQFVAFGQGFKSMSPAFGALSRELLDRRMAHGGHPVMNMCVRNARSQVDPAGWVKPVKNRSTGRIDGVVALIMAMGAAPLAVEEKTYQMLFV